MAWLCQLIAPIKIVYVIQKPYRIYLFIIVVITNNRVEANFGHSKAVYNSMNGADCSREAQNYPIVSLPRKPLMHVWLFLPVMDYA